MKQPNLSEKTVLVTGGGRGIGRATALALARCGARVIVAARTGEEVTAVAKTITDSGGDATAVQVDVSNEEEVEKLFRAIDTVDILVNSAGTIQPIAPVSTAIPPEWQRHMAINLYGVFLTCHYALPSMLERRWGRIVIVSSGAAKGGTAGWSAYASAKAGVEAFTKVLAAEVGGSGVHANAIRPGVVDTEMQVEIRAAGAEDFTKANVERYHRYKREGMLRPPEHPARLILWLLGEEAADLNGEVLAIDDPEVAARIGLEPRGR